MTARTPPTIHPLGDSAWIVEFPTEAGQHLSAADVRIARLKQALDARDFVGFRESVPGLNTVTVHFDPRSVDAAGVFDEIQSALRRRVATEELPPRQIEIPVCYELEFGPDLPLVADLVGMSVEEVVARHTAARLTVRLLGFAPGFSYLTGMPHELAVSRLPRPRTHVPAGSVGIAKTLTGIYPADSAGGWNLIGRTPLVMFDAGADPPSTLLPGDRITIRRISLREFSEWQVST